MKGRGKLGHLIFFSFFYRFCQILADGLRRLPAGVVSQSTLGNPAGIGPKLLSAINREPLH